MDLLTNEHIRHYSVQHRLLGLNTKFRIQPHFIKAAFREHFLYFFLGMNNEPWCAFNFGPVPVATIAVELILLGKNVDLGDDRC